jgi:hypothetical protein
MMMMMITVTMMMVFIGGDDFTDTRGDAAIHGRLHQPRLGIWIPR